VAKLQVALDNTAAELALVRPQLASAEEERTAAAKRSSALLAQWEERDRGQGQEITTLRYAAHCVGRHGLTCVVAVAFVLMQMLQRLHAVKLMLKPLLHSHLGACLQIPALSSLPPAW
jgi:hypothetical protein